MSKPVIAVDLDDVISSQIEVFVAYCNERYDLKLSYQDFMQPGGYERYFEDTVAKAIAIKTGEAEQLFTDFLDQMEPLRQGIEPEVHQALQQLKKDYRLEIVTSRGANYAEPTKTWLQQHAPDVFEDVHFVELWDREDQKATKASICKEIGAGYLIDDSVGHCNLAAEAGVTALLFGDYGWSKNTDVHSNVVRVSDWQAVLEFFDGQSR